jgi:hypothetical protein
MKSYEIFQQMSPALAAEIFGFLNREQKPVMKAAIHGLATARNLRPVYVERKPPNERAIWLQNALSRKTSETAAAQLLHAWLLAGQKAMLCDYLDALEIKHEENGAVETLPDSPPKEKLREVITHLLEKYPAESLAVYLHAFHEMDNEVQWEPLGELLREDERLRLGVR